MRFNTSQLGRRNRALVRRRRALILVIVLVTVVVLALAAYAFTELMLTEYEASQHHGRELQSRAIAESGVDLVRTHLTQSRAARSFEGGDHDNPIAFKHRIIIASAHSQHCGAVTILSPWMTDDGSAAGVRYGLEDESGRLNLNSLLLADRAVENGGRKLLSTLPGMTDEIADAILDWIDADNEPRPYGAESGYYASLDPPYAPSNRPPATVDELLLVRGVTPKLFYSLDGNHNGLIAPHEAAARGREELTAPLGWSRLLTIYSQEANVTAEGKPRIYLNNDNLKQLHEQLLTALSEEWAAFIVAYRQNGQYEGNREGEPLLDRSLDFRRGPRFRIRQVLDLVGAKTLAAIAGEDDGNAIGVLESPISEDDYSQLPDLVDAVSVIPSCVITGRININLAPREVLLGVPGMDEPTVDAILAMRQRDPLLATPERRHETWLLTEGIVDLPQMRAVTPFVTGRGDVHRCQVIGHFCDGSASTRVEIVINAARSAPQVVLWRDLTYLGRGFSLDLLGAPRPEAMGAAASNP